MKLQLLACLGPLLALGHPSSSRVEDKQGVERKSPSDSELFHHRGLDAVSWSTNTVKHMLADTLSPREPAPSNTPTPEIPDLPESRPNRAELLGIAIAVVFTIISPICFFFYRRRQKKKGPPSIKGVPTYEPASGTELAATERSELASTGLSELEQQGGYKGTIRQYYDPVMTPPPRVELSTTANVPELMTSANVRQEMPG